MDSPPLAPLMPVEQPYGFGPPPAPAPPVVPVQPLVVAQPQAAPPVVVVVPGQQHARRYLGPTLAAVVVALVAIGVYGTRAETLLLLVTAAATSTALAALLVMAAVETVRRRP